MNNPTSRDESGPTRPTHVDGAGSARVFLQQLPGALSAEYTIREALATRGAEADLFIVERRTDGRLFVAKVYRQSVTVKIDLLDRVARADADHVVRVVDHGMSDGRYYELQEYLALGSLAELIAREGPRLAPDLARSILRELLMAVRHLHAHGITHRDLKPANVLVRSRQPLDLVLTDFGISSLMNNESVRFTTGNRTIAYSAPESDSGMVTQASDYWSLGMMMAEIITGDHPYAGLSDQVLSGNKATRPVPLAEVQEPWLKLCRGLLVRDPQRRWGSDHVGRWLEGDKTLPEPVVERTLYPEGGAVRPCHFLGKEYSTAEGLAAGFTGNWDEGLKYLERSHLLQWLKDGLCNQELAVFLEDLDQEPDLGGHGKLFRAIRKMNPNFEPSFRELALNEASIATLARRVMAEDTQAQEILLSLQAERILESFGGHAGQGELAGIGERWQAAQESYDALRREVGNAGARQPEAQFQTKAMRLGVLLLGVVDPGFVAEMRRQTGALVTEAAGEVSWFAGLGAWAAAETPTLLLMQELRETAENAGLKQRTETAAKEEDERVRKELQAWRRREKSAIGLSRLAMLMVSFLVGYELTRYGMKTVWNYGFDHYGFWECYFAMGLPALMVFAGVAAGEAVLYLLGCRNRPAFKISPGLALFWLVAPLPVVVFVYIFPLVVFLVYGVVRIFSSAPNIPFSWEEQRIFSGIVFYLVQWLIYFSDLGDTRPAGATRGPGAGLPSASSGQPPQAGARGDR